MPRRRLDRRGNELEEVKEGKAGRKNMMLREHTPEKGEPLPPRGYGAWRESPRAPAVPFL